LTYQKIPLKAYQDSFVRTWLNSHLEKPKGALEKFLDLMFFKNKKIIKIQA